jgi:hypothetical protein
MQDAHRGPVHLVGEDRQRVAHVIDLVDVIVAPAIGAVGQRIEHGVASLGHRLHQTKDLAHGNTTPFGDA